MAWQSSWGTKYEVTYGVEDGGAAHSCVLPPAGWWLQVHPDARELALWAASRYGVRCKEWGLYLESEWDLFESKCESECESEGPRLPTQSWSRVRWRAVCCALRGAQHCLTS